MSCNTLKLLTGIIVIGLSIAAVQSQSRIIGGDVVDIVKYGYLVSIRYRSLNTTAYLHKCAGVIYSPTTVVTAAQCIREIGISDRAVVVAGANTRSGVDGMMHPISKWFAHPKYDNFLMDSDVGVLFVEVPFDFTHSFLRTITIRPSRPSVGKLGYIAGWGYREEFGPSSKTLEETQVPIVSEMECSQSYGPEELTDNMICAGYANGGKDACQGDTGGPLVVDEQLVGLVSWGRGCARAGYPGVYTYLLNLKKWIDDTIAANTV